MKKILSSLSIIVLCSCTVQIPQKPYIVIDKSVYFNNVKNYTTSTEICRFTFITKDGYYLMSDDSCKIYHIGDSIK